MTIIHGDCFEEIQKLGDNSVDLIITSPPYADRRKNTYGGVHSSKYVEWFLPLAHEIKRVLKPTGSFFLNLKAHCDNGERDLYVMKLVIALREEVGFRFTDEFTWTKLGVPGKFIGRFKNAFEPIYHFTIKKGYTHNPYAVAKEASDVSKARYLRKACGESQNGSGLAGMRSNENFKGNNLALPSNHLHITQKSNQYTVQSKHPAVYPVELCDFFIKAFSNEGDVVLDPFVGSGSSGVSAISLDREFIGIDADENYCDMSRARIEAVRLPSKLFGEIK